MKASRIAGLAALALAVIGCESTDKKNKKPPPPPPPGSELSSQPWARPEKEWEGGRPAFLPAYN
jgi:hypothetical protein